MSQTSTASDPTLDAAATPSMKSVRFLRQAALVLVALWVVALVLLVAKTSNPVVLNQQQILSAFPLVVARTIPDRPGEFELVQTLFGPAPSDTFAVDTELPVDLKTSEMWLLPLERQAHGRYQIVPVRFRHTNLVLVYPATPEILDEVKRLLENAKG